MKKIKPYFLAFIIPFLMLFLVFSFSGIINMKYSVLKSDLFFQYYKLFFYLKDVLVGNSSILYSFSKGLGGGMISTYAYYLASPFNLFLKFISYENIYNFVILTIMIKISLCGTTLFSFLKYHFKDKKNIYLFLFSTFYALSLYNIGSYFQLMWLDGLVLAPLVLLGIDKLILEKKSLLYGINLFLVILSNYYIGYMICIFSVLYFIYRCFLNKFDKKIIFKYIIVSVLAGLMTMFLNYPNILDIFGSDKLLKYRMGIINTNILEIISQMFIGSHGEENVLNIYGAFLYCGIIMLPLLLLYFGNNKFSKKERILSFLMILIMLLSIFVNPINYIWHVFSPPNCFNCRYIFLFIVFILYLSCKSFFNINYVSKRYYYMISPILPILGLMIYIYGSFSLIYICISVFLYLIYLFLLYNFKNKEVKMLLILLVFAEAYFNLHITFNNYEFLYNDYIFGRYNEKTESINYIKEKDPSFYRMEFDKTESVNDNNSLYYDYNGASIWLSTVKDIPFFKKIGYEYDSNIYKHFSYPVMDSILGIKYYESINENKYYNKIYTHKVSENDNEFYNLSKIDSNIYENPYSLSLGYMVNKNVKNSNLNLDCFINQNKIINDMTNLDLLVYEKQEVDNYIYNIKTLNDFYIKFDINSSGDRYSYKVYLNDKFYKEITYDDVDVVYVLNDYNIGDEIKIEIKSDDVSLNNLDVYTMNDNFIKHIDYLKDNQLNVTQFKDGYVKGNIDVKENGVLFTSILYDENWNVLVDGNEADKIKIYDTFIGIDLNDGFHEIEFIYKPKGLKIGMIVSISSLLFFIFYQIYEQKNNKNSSN